MSSLPTIIRLSGMFGPVLTVLGLVVVFLSLKAAWAATERAETSRKVLRDRTNAVLFWGAAAAVLGFLGQCQGTYLALNEIISAPELSPQVVAEGFVISFIPTLFGLGILAFSGVAWVSLRYLSPISGLRISQERKS
ncbi:MAG: hypothetical protein HKO65_09945 [Gemmatimonadetes bacterium]|nr:hypothetical protein [Gemmatimonadota bacterium]NNM05414.1 hypothetical protein [Gemmatimonadota bacterium]